MRYIIYIGAALAIGLLIGFVALSVIWLRKAMVRSVRGHTMGLLDAYDKLLARKSQELRDLEAEAPAEVQAPAPAPAEHKPASQPEAPAGVALAAAERAATAPYRDKDPGELYRTIRQNFAYRVEELAPALPVLEPEGEGPAAKTLQILPFDTAYRLSTLTGDQQLEILGETLPPESLQLLLDYLRNTGPFNALEFYDHLRAAATAEAGTVKLYVTPDIAPGTVGRVELVPRADICEGFQAEMDGTLYDYSITRRELRG